MADDYKLPNPNLGFSGQDPLILLAMLIWGEARGENAEGKLAVGWVVRNRTALQPRFGIGWKGVILKPWQFSCFNENDPNRVKLLTPIQHEGLAVWSACVAAASVAFAGDGHDPSNGGLVYFSKPITAPPPAWGNVRPTAQIGGLHFYR